MLRKCVLGLGIVSLVVCAFAVTRSDTAAQPEKSAPVVEPPTAKALKQSNTLPVKQVVLFNSGVGYFHRSGQIDGNARVDMQFSAANINDLIKSLLVHDARGKTMPLQYDSQEPIEKTLKSFGIDLSYNPSFGQILNQARGEKVEITLQNNNTGLPGTLNGVIVGMETAQRVATPTATNTAEMEFLNLMCQEGLRTVPLSQVQRLRFLNPTLENELRRALDVVAVGHDSQKKSVRIDFKGDGKRDVSVGYVIENPIWKTSYRLVMGKDKPKLLGWANVENTSDEDWNDIKLTLVSGRPISFQMDLYPPLNIPRPLIEPELFASLRPPTYQGPLTHNMNPVDPMQSNLFQGNNVNLGIGGGMVGNLFQGNNVNLGIGGGIQGFGGQVGNLGNQFGFQGGNRFQNPMQQFMNNDNSSKITYKEMQERRNTAKQEQTANQQKNAAQIGGIISNVDPTLIEAALTAEELGNPARYSIDQKVSLPRQQSAMLPILEQEIEATRVSIYNEQVQAKHPLLSLKIKNTSKQSLMSGPITIYDDEQYVGDARVLDLQPGEDRFISYAVDTAVEVKPFDRVQPAPELLVKVVTVDGSLSTTGTAQNLQELIAWDKTDRFTAGRLQVQYKLRQTRSYVIKNRSLEARTVVIEQPTRNGWVFAEAKKVVQVKDAWKAGDSEKPMERTRDLYRFSVEVKAGETVKYEVSEELPRVDPFQVSQQTDFTGFATSLGLDVWTNVKRTPEDFFAVQVVKADLQVTHKDRRSVTYFFRNRINEERTVWLEHIVPLDRKLLGAEKPEADNARRFRFKLTVPAGKTVSYMVSEELVHARPELFALQTIEGTPVPRPGTDDVPQQRFVTELGFEVWTSKRKAADTLESVTFVKGQLATATREQEVTTVHFRNRSTEDRKFALDHVVRPDWNLVGNQKPVENAGLRYRFELPAGKNQIVKQEVSEEHRVSKQETLASLTSDRLKDLLASPVPSAAVKDGLRKGTGLIKTLESTQNTLKELRAQMKEINEEQARLKTNMEKLPTDSALYKRLVEKLDKQETALEDVQKQIKEKIEAEKKQRLELTAFLDGLTVNE